MNDAIEQNIIRIEGNPVKSVLSVDEKLRIAATDKPVFKTQKADDVPLENQPTKSYTLEMMQIENNVAAEDANETITKSNVLFETKPVSLKGKKIFRIKKYVKYNKFLSEICSDEELSEKDKKTLKEPQNRKISPFSKVNFSKLRVEEKDERLKNLALLVKRLRRKVRNLEHKVRFNATKLLNKHLWNKLGINTKNKYLTPEFQFDFDKICKALKRVRGHEEFEYSDEKHLIENVINLIADDHLKFDSLIFKKMCTLVRRCLNKDKIRSLNKKQAKHVIEFPETEVYVSNQEYQQLCKFKENDEAKRAILGLDFTSSNKAKNFTKEIVDNDHINDSKSQNALAGLLLNSSSGLFANNAQSTQQHNPVSNSQMAEPSGRNSGFDLLNSFNQSHVQHIPGIGNINSLNTMNNTHNMSTMNNMHNMGNMNATNTMNNIHAANNLNNVNSLNPYGQMHGNVSAMSNAPNNLNSNANPLNMWLLNNSPQMQSYLMNSLAMLGNSFNGMPGYNTQNLLNMGSHNLGHSGDQSKNMFLK